MQRELKMYQNIKIDDYKNCFKASQIGQEIKVLENNDQWN